jgi:hypothetical protein
MYPTVEVRWFYEGPIPSEMRAWFHSGSLPSPEDQPTRVDRYLCITDCDALGIKLRGDDETLIEIKQRVQDSHFRRQVVHIYPGVTGLVEQWRKWSLPLAKSDWDPVPATAWVHVKKARLMHTFNVRGSEIVPVEDDGRRSSVSGCALELSTIHAVGQTWWSLCFEAFGEAPRLYEILLQVSARIFTVYSDDLPISLEAQDSYGYPRWLVYILQAPSPNE